MNRKADENMDEITIKIHAMKKGLFEATADGMQWGLFYLKFLKKLLADCDLIMPHCLDLLG